MYGQHSNRTPLGASPLPSHFTPLCAMRVQFVPLVGAGLAQQELGNACSSLLLQRVKGNGKSGKGGKGGKGGKDEGSTSAKNSRQAKEVRRTLATAGRVAAPSTTSPGPRQARSAEKGGGASGAESQGKGVLTRSTSWFKIGAGGTVREMPTPVSAAGRGREREDGVVGRSGCSGRRQAAGILIPASVMAKVRCVMCFARCTRTS